MSQTIVPILILLGLGVFCRRKAVFDSNGIEALKTLSIRFLWPVVLFYAFFTAKYDSRTIYYASTMFVLLTVTFFMSRGFLRKRLKKHAFSLPYLTVGSEIGMLGYSLYLLLFGAENVYRLALFDVGHAVFLFPIYLSCLNTEQGSGDLKSSLKDMVRSPLIIMLVIGMVCGVSGAGDAVMNSMAGAVIERVYSLASSANIVLMLVSMGYGLSFTKEQIKDCLGVIGIRAAAMAVCTALGLLFLHLTIGLETAAACALILTFSLPPVYLLSVYIKDPEENAFAATMTSVYTVFSVILFLCMTAIVR